MLSYSRQEEHRSGYPGSSSLILIRFYLFQESLHFMLEMWGSEHL